MRPRPIGARAARVPLIVDVGTGSGIIAITLALLLPGSKVVGVDISEEALAVARRNADYHQVEVEFRQGICSSPLQDLRGRIDTIVSNPPYIAAGEWEELPGRCGKSRPRPSSGEPMDWTFTAASSLRGRQW